MNLQSCVEKLAGEFMALEEEIIANYERLKSQLHENVP